MRGRYVLKFPNSNTLQVVSFTAVINDFAFVCFSTCDILCRLTLTTRVV